MPQGKKKNHIWTSNFYFKATVVHFLECADETDPCPPTHSFFIHREMVYVDLATGEKNLLSPQFCSSAVKTADPIDRELEHSGRESPKASSIPLGAQWPEGNQEALPYTEHLPCWAHSSYLEFYIIYSLCKGRWSPVEEEAGKGNTRCHQMSVQSIHAQLC